MQLHLGERFSAYTGIFQFGIAQKMMPAASSFVKNLFKGFSDPLDRAFAEWYSSKGHFMAAYEAQMTPVPRLVGLANGVVLELGPAQGNQLPRFDRSAVSRIYGLEPNVYLFEELKQNVAKDGALVDVYVPVHAALEDDALLATSGITPGSVDTIVCMQVLCSVIDLDDAVRRMHHLLKPGGQLLFWEHQASRDIVTRCVQGVWNLVWAPLIGGCRLNREIEAALLRSGNWEVSEVGEDDTQPWSLMPRYWGRFVKK